MTARQIDALDTLKAGLVLAYLATLRGDGGAVERHLRDMAHSIKRLDPMPAPSIIDNAA